MRRTVIVAALVVLLVMVASAHAQLTRFDFGSAASPVEPGYTRVAPESAYADAAGLGWQTELRVIPSVAKWWNPEEKGGILSTLDTAKGGALATNNEVVVDGFKVAQFNSSPLDVNANLILIGSEATNPIIAKLGAEGTFCFDKVLISPRR